MTYKPLFGGPPPDNERQPTMLVGWPRRDGKVPVTFTYYSAGRTLRKLYTAEQIKEAVDSGNYNVL